MGSLVGGGGIPKYYLLTLSSDNFGHVLRTGHRDTFSHILALLEPFSLVEQPPVASSASSSSTLASIRVTMNRVTGQVNRGDSIDEIVQRVRIVMVLIEVLVSIASLLMVKVLARTISFTHTSTVAVLVEQEFLQSHVIELLVKLLLLLLLLAMLLLLLVVIVLPG